MGPGAAVKTDFALRPAHLANALGALEGALPAIGRLMFLPRTKHLEPAAPSQEYFGRR